MSTNFTKTEALIVDNLFTYRQIVAALRL